MINMNNTIPQAKNDDVNFMDTLLVSFARIIFTNTNNKEI